jgi:CHAT domain-containing protein
LIERSNELSAILLKPVASELGHKRILIVADGALHYLPFAMLPVPNEQASFTPLVVEHEVVTLPSASVLALIRKELNGRKPAPKSLAILADPVFDKTDERLRLRNSINTRRRTSTDLRQSEMNVARRDAAVFDSSRRALRDFNDQEIGNGIARLPFSRREAEAIMGSASTKDAMLALGFRANRATATAPELSQYRIVHFATHGLLNSKHPELSGILLSLYDDAGKHEDGFLQLPEIYNLNLPADLVVLSACQTALGKDIRGEGLVGLTRGFMYAGAARVVASLWQIDDAATADLMGEFYRAMLKEGMRPAEALRAAQVHMWKQKQWSSPYYWAAFTLQGEWR